MLLAAIATLVLILIGLPLAYAFGFGALLAFATLADIGQIPAIAYRSIDSFPLLAIPFFLLAGEIMRSGGVSRRLLEFVSLFVGRIRGGMGATLLGGSAIFGAISGSSVATVSAMGSIMTPEMVQRGYPRRYVAGMTSVAGLLGILIPPSIPLVVYGVAANVSISALFLGGLSAGLLLLLAMIVVNLVWARSRPDLRDSLSTLSTGGSGGGRLAVLPVKQVGVAVPALAMPAVILGGIYSGVFTPTEAGAVACLYGVLIGLLVYRELRPKHLPDVLARAALATTPILLIIGFGAVFSRALTLSGVTVDLTQWVADLDASVWVIMLAINILLLLVGCFVEENTAIIILAPLLLPVVTQLGVDPVHFGIIMVLNLGIGLATPPMAPNVFVAARACDIDFHQMVSTTLLFLATAALPVLVVVNLVPALSTWGA